MGYGFGYTNMANNGLIFYLDAQNGLSYSSQTNRWRSIAGDASNGELFGDASFDDDYLGRKAIRFDGGDDFVKAQTIKPSTLDINKTGIITVQAAFAINSLPQLKRVIFSAGSNGTNNEQYGIGIDSPTDTIDVYVINHNSEQRITAGGRLNNAAFPYHVITVMFGSSKKVYFNADEVGTHTITHTTSFGDYWIVGDKINGGCCLDGAVNAIRVYDRALTAAEISRSYQFFTKRK